MDTARPTEAEIDLVLDRLSTGSTTEGDEIIVFVDRASVGPALEAFLAARRTDPERTPPCGA